MLMPCVCVFVFFVNVVQHSYFKSFNVAVEIIYLCSGASLSHGVAFLLSAMKRLCSLRSILNAVQSSL